MYLKDGLCLFETFVDNATALVGHFQASMCMWLKSKTSLTADAPIAFRESIGKRSLKGRYEPLTNDSNTWFVNLVQAEYHTDSTY